MAYLERIIKNFTHGRITEIENESAPEGSSSAGRNWLSRGDRIELRRGQKVLGTELAGNGRVSGLAVGKKWNGENILVWTHGRKFKYYDETLEDHVEIGSNLLPADADGEDVSFSRHQTLAGAQLWASSPNSDLYKFMTADVADVISMSETVYRGRIKIRRNRMWVFGTTADRTNPQLSWIDAQENYTTVTNEAFDTGDGGKVYSGTLVFKAGGAKRSCFAIVVNDEDSIETFTDDYEGILAGSAGGTGTINYATGEIAVTFNANVAIGKEIRATYQWEDPSDEGVADFSESATRVAGEGLKLFQADDGAELYQIEFFEDISYQAHSTNIWSINLTDDDTNVENKKFREAHGIPSSGAFVSTSLGIVFVDTKDENDPHIRLLNYGAFSENVKPRDISPLLDLSGYRFDKAEIIEFENMILVACRQKDKTFNDTVWALNTDYFNPQTGVGPWDELDYTVSKFVIYDGMLVAGDSISNNLYVLFSGIDDNDSLVSGAWETELSDLDIEQLKKTRTLHLTGRIGKNQSMKVFGSFDRSSYVELGNKADLLAGTAAIVGSGSYVDQTQSINVGAFTLGRGEVGGGSFGGSISAGHYERDIEIRTDRYRRLKLKFVPQGIGWLDISQYGHKNILRMGHKLATKYQS